MAGRRHQGTAVRELVLPLNFLRWVECAGRCISHFPGRLVTDICCEVAVRQTSSSSRAHLNILTFLIVCAPRRALTDADFDGESERSVVVLGSSGRVRYALFNHVVYESVYLSPHCQSVRLSMCLLIRGFYILNIPSPSITLLAWWHEEKKGVERDKLSGTWLDLFAVWAGRCFPPHETQRTSSTVMCRGPYAYASDLVDSPTAVFTQACRLYILYGLDFLPVG
jgi:hypothetical protein